MSAAPGRALLHYRIVEKIGEGGMGVVWRAVDTTLNREVAIKLLPEALAADGERVARFEREGRVLASLNHPNIATIHGIHEAPSDGGAPVRFLAMELVEGEDLEARIAREPISLERAAEIAIQVATALEAAHAQGVVHRDLKPANIKLTADGDAKVLDFGLAKALANEPASGSTSPAMSPTLTSAGTVAGMILGTAAYMAPEQARGKPVDKRADLWAFGAVLFEMLTARRCFEGETISDTLAAVLKEQPDWSLLPGDTPPAIRRLLRRCLTKDVRRRLGDAGAARLELAEAFDPPDPAEVVRVVEAAPPPEVLQAPAGRLPWIVAGAAVLAAIGVWILGDGPSTPPAREPVELSIPIPQGVALNDDQDALLEVSPDGRYLVFGGFEGDSSSRALYLRKLDDSTIVKLPDTAGSLNPFMSPDGEWVAFFADGKLKKIRVDGTTAITIAPVQGAGTSRGGSWGSDDHIVFPAHFASGLVRVPASGGEPTPLTELDAARQERTHRWPHVVAEHDVVLFTVATTDSPEFYDNARIDAVRLSTGERKTVFEGASFARYVPSGHLVFGRGGVLYGVPFDIEALETQGSPTPVVEGVTGAVNSGVVFATIAENGLLAYVPGRPEGPKKRLMWMYADGREQPVSGVAPGGYIDQAISPDGKFVAVSAVDDRTRNIWVLDLERESRARVTFTGDNVHPVWTPDGKLLYFHSIRDGVAAVYVTAADGSGGERLLERLAGTAPAVSDVSPDGAVALFDTSFEDTASDVYVRSLRDPDLDPVPFANGPHEEQGARFSPDGRWVAYVTDESGDFQVVVRPYPGPGGRWQISNGGGTEPHWSADGRRIHYRTGRDWWVVDVETGDGPNAALRAGLPRSVRSDLPRARLEFSGDFSDDRNAMLVSMAEGDAGTPEEIRVVTDWFQELERLVGPVGD